MKKSKMLFFVLFFTLIVSIIGYSIAYPSRVQNYYGSQHVGCHGSNEVGTGSLTATPTVSGRVITIAVTITGFTEPTTVNNSHGSISVGIPYNYGDNSKFGHGMHINTVDGHDNVWHTSVWEADATTETTFTFEVLAPEASGTYVLHVVTLTGFVTWPEDMESTLYRLEDTITVVVAGSTVSIA